jgi:ureidoacrylate peracid hydrolase
MKSPTSAIIILALVGAGFIVASQASPREKTAGATTRVIRLNAKPEPIEIDTASTAVIVVDMQNDFGAQGGMFDRDGIDISGIQKVIDPTAKVLASARRAGIKIIYLKMGFRPDLSDLGSPDSPNRVRNVRIGVGQPVRAPDGSEGRILIRDTWNTDIVSQLKTGG